VRRETIQLKDVAIADVDPRYFERPYHLLPSNDNAAEGYLVIRDALAEAGKAGIGQVVIGGREHLVALAPLGKGLVLEIIRYGSELKPAEKFSPISPTHSISGWSSKGSMVPWKRHGRQHRPWRQS
jgi:DNA end-binding protein Ku